MSKNKQGKKAKPHRDLSIKISGNSISNDENQTNSLSLDAYQKDMSSVDILEDARTKWQYGSWQDLADINTEELQQDPNREKLALLVAAACSHLGDMPRARRLILQALSWGCSQELAARVMLSAVHNTLARVSTSLQDEAAEQHFVESLRIVEPRADTRLLAQTRWVRESIHLGLLPDAQKLLSNSLKSLRGSSVEDTDKLKILSEEVDILRQELMISISRNQIYDHSKIESNREDVVDRSTSQLGQDIWVLEKTGFKRGGFFIEFGASDGILLSNTYLLENEFEWQGICAEPNPKFFSQLKNNRKCIVSNSCIGGTTGEKVEFIFADVYGTMSKYIDSDSHLDRRNIYLNNGDVDLLETISLDDLLTHHNAPREIDYMSIDTEGSEYAILSKFPFDKWKIKLITVEHNYAPQRDEIRNLLEGLGYERTEMKWDDFYEMKSSS